MSKHLLTASSVAAVALVLSTGPGTAHADHTQPADLGNVVNVDRGASAPGPHCHFVLAPQGAGPFANIITGAAHQGHTETAGVFQATTCP